MFKTYTLKRIVDEQLTKTEGKRFFQLVDESGIKRVVCANTIIDDNKIIKVIGTSKREQPLLDSLFSSNINQAVNIDFSQYGDTCDQRNEPVIIL